MSQNLQRDLETCIRNQAECAAYRGPDMAGAWAGLCDWVMEECLIRQQMAKPPFPLAERLQGVR